MYQFDYVIAQSGLIQLFEMKPVPDRLPSNGSRAVFLHTNSSKASGDGKVN